MRWGRDRSGILSHRLYFDSLCELDEECQRMLELTYFRRRGKQFIPPLDDDTLQVLIEDDADLDLFCELESGVEAYTEFRSGSRPIIRISTSISNAPHRRLRFRTTMAHEWFHACYHGVALEKLWAIRRSHGVPPEDARGKCLHDDMIGAPDSNWPEFQAGFASCAILMPRTWVQNDLSEIMASGVTNFDSIAAHIASKYEVSQKAAQWRLQQLGVHRQLRLW